MGERVHAHELQVRKAPLRKNGNCPLSFLPETIQLSLSLYVSDTSQVTVPSPELRVSGSESVFVWTL